jgi:hypothetical protein
LLPVCQACRDGGALPLTRTRKRNGSNTTRQKETARLAEEVRDDREAEEAAPSSIPPVPSAQPVPVVAAQRQVLRRNRRPLMASSHHAPTPGVL